MSEVITTSTRLPRGTKPVAQAFLAALDALPSASRVAVARAAQAMIRDELKTRREKLKALPKVKAKTKAAPAKAVRAVKAAPSTRRARA